MPSVVSSYIYTLVALTAVSALLIYSLNSYAYTLRASAETDQLQSILNGVAAKANEVLTLVTTTNSSLTVYLNLPTTIGNQYYWMRMRNDSSKAWVEGSLGDMFEGNTDLQVLIPCEATLSGHFISTHGQATLQGYMNGSTPQLNLASVGG
jgi:hypothetical protein